MKVHFRGTRGSIPTAQTAHDITDKVVSALLAARGKDLRSEGQIREFVGQHLPFHTGSGYGGNTPCVQVSTGADEFLIFDAGSGIRSLGQEIVKDSPSDNEFHLFFSHFHYDHIQGLPFFAPAYIPGNRIVIHGCHNDFENFLREQMRTPFFPIDFDSFQSEIIFQQHAPGDLVNVCDSEISIYKLNHPGDSYGYRVQREEKSVVYASDSEHPNIAHGKDYDFIDFINGSNLLIFDAPYTHSESINSREHWGHSSNVMGVELAARGKVETLAIFHHDPNLSDVELCEFHGHTKKFLDRSRVAVREAKPGIPGAPSPRSHPYEVIMSYDGLQITI